MGFLAFFFKLSTVSSSSSNKYVASSSSSTTRIINTTTTRTLNSTRTMTMIMLLFVILVVVVMAEDTDDTTTSSDGAKACRHSPTTTAEVLSWSNGLTWRNIGEAIRLWQDNKIEAEKKYGKIEHWDTCAVTSLVLAFAGTKDFNADLSSWDVSSVKNMHQIFHNTKNFNANVSTWDTSKVEDMTLAFADTEHFTADVSTWDVSTVTTMGGIFRHSKNFGSDVSSWDTSNVRNFAGAFYGASGRFNNNNNNNNKKTPLCWDLSATQRSYNFLDQHTLSQFSCDSTQVGFDCSCISNYVDTTYADEDGNNYASYFDASLSNIINSHCPRPTPSCIDSSNAGSSTMMKLGLFNSLMGSLMAMAPVILFGKL